MCKWLQKCSHDNQNSNRDQEIPRWPGIWEMVSNPFCCCENKRIMSTRASHRTITITITMFIIVSIRQGQWWGSWEPWKCRDWNVYSCKKSNKRKKEIHNWCSLRSCEGSGKNDPTRDLINFMREEMDKAREHELKMFHLLQSSRPNASSAVTAYDQQQQGTRGMYQGQSGFSGSETSGSGMYQSLYNQWY